MKVTLVKDDSAIYYSRTATGSVCIYREPNECRAFDDMVYLVKSLKAENLWVLPKGGLEDGLTPEQNAVKEMQEEGGLDVSIVSPPIFDEVLAYEAQPDFPAKLQREIYFLSRFDRVSTEWEEEGQRETAWVFLSDLHLYNMTDIQRGIVEKAYDYFKTTHQFPVSTSHRA